MKSPENQLDEQNESTPETFSYVGFVFNCIGGIAIAGLLFPIIVAIYATFRFVVPEFVIYGVRGHDVVSILASCMGSILIACFAGFLIAVFSSWISGLLICAINMSLGYPLRPKAFISCVGGLSGFAPLSLLFIHPDSLFVYGEAIEAFVIGPCLATLVGQTGARWWARKSVLYPTDPQIALPQSQFRIAHVLALTAWMALAMSILRLTTETNLPILVAIYIPVQFVCLGIGQLIDRWMDWRTGIRFVN